MIAIGDKKISNHLHHITQARAPRTREIVAPGKVMFTTPSNRLMSELPKNIRISELGTGDPVPYHVLLLADETREAIDKYAHTGNIYILENETQIIAVYVLSPLNDFRIELKNIAVLQAFQRKGIGRLLLSDAIIRAKKLGYGEIIVGTPAVSEALTRFYKSVGFSVCGIRKNFYADNYPDPIIEDGILLTDMIVLKMKLGI